MPGRLATPRVHELDAGRADREGTTEEAIRGGHIATIPAGRYGRPEELGPLVAFLASERATYITGQLIAVDGGQIAGL
jgi:3-oxoacyl-[acyl-carrier protein] reductase